MNRLKAIRRQSLRDASGASVIEFALILPVFMLFILGFFDFAYWMYVRSTATGALEGAARSAGVGGAAFDPSASQAAIETQIKRIAPNATFIWSTRNYYQFSGINKPEKLITDVNNNGQYDAGDCWEDLNPNGNYDISPGRSGIGGADDILFYQMTVTFPPLVSIAKFVPGLGGNHTSVINTIIRRQPYAAQATPQIRC